MDEAKLAALKQYIQNLKDDQMKALAMVESSGGQNLQHALVTKGLNKGHTAGGPWGLMPISAAETLKKNPQLGQKYPEFGKMLQNIDQNKEAITQMLNDNPELAYDFSSAKFKRNLKEFPDLNGAVHAWYHGNAGTKKKMAKEGPESINTADYVQKFKKYYQPERAIAANPAQPVQAPMPEQAPKEVDFEKLKQLLAQNIY